MKILITVLVLSVVSILYASSGDVTRGDIVKYVEDSENCKMSFFNRLVIVDGKPEIGLPLFTTINRVEFKKRFQIVKKKCHPTSRRMTTQSGG